jgi:hypothetical protein
MPETTRNKKTLKWIGFSFLAVILVYSIVIFNRHSEWQKLLNSEDRTITYAFVFDYSEVGKHRNDYYDYFYKIDSSFLFGCSSGRNINKEVLDNKNLEVFTAVVSNQDPTVNCVIWEQKHKFINQIGKKQKIPISEETIWDYTSGIGLTVRGEIDKELETKIKQYTAHR